MKPDTNSWETPQWLFDELNEEFNFDIDLCATKENSKCNIWYQDYLHDVQIEKVYLSPRVATMREYQEIGNANYTCFMNPPYSHGSMEKFIGKAWRDSKYCKIVCLVKGDFSTKWWSIFYDADNWEERPGCKIRLLPKRVKFDPPKEWEGETSGPSFPSAVLIFDRRGL